MKKIRKILYAVFWCLLVSALIVTLGFAEKQEAKVICKKPVISINEEDNNYFITEDDITCLLRSKGDSINGQPLPTVDVNKIEKLMYTNPWVKSANAYLSIDGVLNIEIEVRKPLVRIINKSGENYYLDTDGKLMLWSPAYTPRVLVADGNIDEPYHLWYSIPADKIMQNDSLAHTTLLDDIYVMAKYISADPFWNMQVTEIVNNTSGDLEIVPLVGSHKIIFGDTTALKEKFSKLKIFYKEGLNHTNWNNYDTLNLKYKNQVVCTKLK